MATPSTVRSIPSVTNSGSEGYSSSNSDRSDFVKLHRTLSTKSFAETFTRNIERDPYEIYQHAKVLGTGSMGSVQMVKKRDRTIGGTARWHNLSTKQKLELKGVHPSLITACTLPWIGDFIMVCAGINEEEEKESAFQGIDSLNVSRHRHKFQFPIASEGSFASGLDNLNVSRRRRELETCPEIGCTDVFPHTHEQPTHIRINEFLEKEKKRGYYEAFYALKCIHLDRVHDKVYIHELKNEIAIMKKLDHPHITRLIETYEYKGELFLVMELSNGGDLYSRDPYTEDQAARIVGSILSAVDFMHSHDIIHRDLKYENILFASPSPTAEIKIIDFGLSKIYDPQQRLNEGVGTVYTMAPEVLRGDYNNKVDVWAVGVLAYMLLSSQMPFYGRKRKEILDKIKRCNYDFDGRRWSTVSIQAQNFISDILIHDPDQRPTAHEAKKSVWLNMRLTSSVRTATEDDMDNAAFSIENYLTHKTLQKLALMVVAHKSNSEEIGFLRNVFKRYDQDRDGFINLTEFKKCLSKYEYSDEFLEKLFFSANLNGTGNLQYTEFLAATIESTDLVTEERLAEAFDNLDIDNSGFITVKGLKALLGDDVPEKYIEEVIAEAKVKYTDRVSYADFLNMWRQEIEDKKMNRWRGISKERTVSNLMEEMFTSCADDEVASNDSSDNDYQPFSTRLISIAEIEEKRSQSFTGSTQ